MKDNENQEKGGAKVNAPIDLMLAREIRNLDPEMMPTRDLWSGIERNMIEYPQRKKSEWAVSWMPVGVAASLVIAVSALVVNMLGINQQPSQLLSAEHAITAVQSHYLEVRNPLIDQFAETNKSLAPETLEELYRNIQIVENARKDIEAQVRMDPDNQRLVAMLMRIHEKEIKLLKQDYSKPGRFL